MTPASERITVSVVRNPDGLPQCSVPVRRRTVGGRGSLNAQDSVPEQRFMDDFRRFFLRGLAALVPTLLTFAIIVWAYRLINDNVGTPITTGLMHMCSWVSERPAPGLVDADIDPLRYGTPLNEWDDLGRRLTIEAKIIDNYKAVNEKYSGGDREILEAALTARNEALWRIAFAKWKLHILGFMIGIILVYFVGFFLASFIGRTSWRAAETLLHRIPLIRAIYPHVKQVTDFLLSERDVAFSGVVAVQYPRKGIWSIGLRTGPPVKQVQQRVPDDLVTVFIPSSPTPITGYVIQVPQQDVIALNMTIDEGLRFTVSGGVIKPGALPAGDTPTGSS